VLRIDAGAWAARALDGASPLPSPVLIGHVSSLPRYKPDAPRAPRPACRGARWMTSCTFSGARAPWGEPVGRGACEAQRRGQARSGWCATTLCRTCCWTLEPLSKTRSVPPSASSASFRPATPTPPPPPPPPRAPPLPSGSWLLLHAGGCARRTGGRTRRVRLVRGEGRDVSS